MAGFTPFTSNYTDLSDENGYQFEFRCDICGSGYRSEFIRSNAGHGGQPPRRREQPHRRLLRQRRPTRADRVKDITDRGARDEALKKAANEIMALFTRCPRCNKLGRRDLLERGARPVRRAARRTSPPRWRPSAPRSSSTRCARRCSAETVFSGDTSARSTVCTNCGKPVGSEKFCSNCGTPTGQNKCAPVRRGPAPPARASAGTAARRPGSAGREPRPKPLGRSAAPPLRRSARPGVR